MALVPSVRQSVAVGERGQTLVLFALTLLLVTLMVMMTLSFSTKAKEKMELQQVADQAAYSNAVVVARGLNSLALLNRVQIADMVAIAGIQGALSYAAVYRGSLAGAEQAILMTAGKYSAQCTSSLGLYRPACEAAKALKDPLQKARDEQDRVTREWEQPTLLGSYLGGFGMVDSFVGLYALVWQMNAMSIFLVHQQETFMRMADKLKEQTLARAVMRHSAGNSPEWLAPEAASFVSSREIGDLRVGSGVVNGAVLQGSPVNQHAVVAAMASRGNWWVTARMGESGLIERKLNRVFNPPPGDVPDLPVAIKPPRVDMDLPSGEVDESEFWSPSDLFSLPPRDPVITVKMITPGPLFALPPMPSWFPSGLVSSLIPYMGKGDAYFARARHGADQHIVAMGPSGKPNDAAVMADDHADGFLQFWKAPFRAYPLAYEPLLFSGFGFASAGTLPILTNVHRWTGFPLPMSIGELLMDRGNLVSALGGSDKTSVHPLKPLSGFGIWPLFMDYNFAKVVMTNDAYGQPKNFAVIQRDYRARPQSADPWNLFFRFRLNGSGTQFGQGTEADPNAIVLGDGTDISLQTALSSGISYYHRFDHWAEPPNLFNPFWRAGLTRANIDPKSMDGVGRDWFEDVADTLDSSGVPWAGEAIKSLDRVGFQGVQ